MPVISTISKEKFVTFLEKAHMDGINPAILLATYKDGSAIITKSNSSIFSVIESPLLINEERLGIPNIKSLLGGLSIFNDGDIKYSIKKNAKKIPAEITFTQGTLTYTCTLNLPTKYMFDDSKDVYEKRLSKLGNNIVMDFTEDMFRFQKALSMINKDMINTDKIKLVYENKNFVSIIIGNPSEGDDSFRFEIPVTVTKHIANFQYYYSINDIKPLLKNHKNKIVKMDFMEANDVKGSLMLFEGKDGDLEYKYYLQNILNMNDD